MSRVNVAWTACLVAAMLVLLAGFAACDGGSSSVSKKGTLTPQVTPSRTSRVTPIDPTVQAAEQATATADDVTHQSYDATNSAKESDQRATERAREAAQSTAQKATQQAQKTQARGGGQ